MTITLLGRDSSSNVQKVRWALVELGLSYEHIPARRQVRRQQDA